MRTFILLALFVGTAVAAEGEGCLADIVGPVDCVGDWGIYGDCNAICGPGVQTRTYRVTIANQNGGLECPTEGGATQSQVCNYGECGDGLCPAPSAGCGPATAGYCINDLPCAQDTAGTWCYQRVLDHTCNVDCIGSWSDFDICSAPNCGGGIQNRSFEEQQVKIGNGVACNHTKGDKETRVCNTGVCRETCSSEDPVCTQQQIGDCDVSSRACVEDASNASNVQHCFLYRPRPYCAWCYFDELVLPDGTAQQGSGCETGGRVLDGTTCEIRKTGTNCGNSLCTNGTLAPVACDAQPCQFSDLVFVSGSSVSGTGCTLGGTVDSGNGCTVSKVGHTCSNPVCEEAAWDTSAPTCSIGGTVNTISTSEFTVGVTAPTIAALNINSGSHKITVNCNPMGSGQVVLLTYSDTDLANAAEVCAHIELDFQCPGFSLYMSCLSDGSTGGTVSGVVTEQSCDFGDVTFPTGALIQGDGCESGGKIISGAACAVTVTGYNCAGVTCHKGAWSTTSPDCVGTPVFERFSQVKFENAANSGFFAAVCPAGNEQYPGVFLGTSGAKFTFVPTLQSVVPLVSNSQTHIVNAGNAKAMAACGTALGSCGGQHLANNDCGGSQTTYVEGPSTNITFGDAVKIKTSNGYWCTCDTNDAGSGPKAGCPSATKYIHLASSYTSGGSCDWIVHDARPSNELSAYVSSLPPNGCGAPTLTGHFSSAIAPSPTPSPEVQNTPTPSPDPTATPATPPPTPDTPTPFSTPADTPSATPPDPTPEDTPSPTNTPTPSDTPNTPSATPSPSPTPPDTPSPTGSPTPPDTPIPDSTPVAPPSPSPTMTPFDTQFQWFRADSPSRFGAVAISGAQLSTYTPTDSDLGKFLFFEVTSSPTPPICVPAFYIGTVYGCSGDVQAYSKKQRTLSVPKKAQMKTNAL